MIKDKEKREYITQNIKQTVLSYLRTILVSFFVALIFTIILSFHARSEMIKNIYVHAEERLKMDERIAKQIIAQSDLTKDLITKNYAICMQVGNLYASAQDYKNAQYVYEMAIEKAPPKTYQAYQKLVSVLVAQEKFDEAKKILTSIQDEKNVKLIKFKTRAFIEMGDKYYSKSKFLSAAKSYENAQFYYNRFNKRDKFIDKSIKKRIVNSYIQTADIMAKNGYNSEAIRFLQKAFNYEPNNFNIKYKLAIVYADFDPIKSVQYFEDLLEKMPQSIDYSVYTTALMKAANIADLEGNPVEAKYYRYKIHSIDVFINQKVIYKDSIQTILDSFTVRKSLFKYKLQGEYHFKNISSADIYKLSADFVLKQNDKIKEEYTVPLVNKKNPLFSYGGETKKVKVNFGKQIFTKQELNQYYIEIYIYKNEKYKTLVTKMRIPLKSISQPKLL